MPNYTLITEHFCIAYFMFYFTPEELHLSLQARICFRTFEIIYYNWSFILTITIFCFWKTSRMETRRKFYESYAGSST